MRRVAALIAFALFSMASTASGQETVEGPEGAEGVGAPRPSESTDEATPEEAARPQETRGATPPDAGTASPAAPPAGDTDTTEEPPGVPEPPAGYGTSAPAPGPAPTSAPVRAPASAPPEAAPVDDIPFEAGDHPDDVRFVDANADRVILFSTAETHPEGTFFFTDYELVLLQFGYAFTDWLQGTITGLPPLIDEQPFFFDLALKANLLRQERIRLAAAGSVLVVADGDGNGFFGGTLRGVGTLCLTQTCQTSLSANIGTFLNNETSEVLPIYTGVGFIGRVSDLVAFLVEPVYGTNIGDDDLTDGFILNYGLRLSGTQWGLDITFIRPFEDDSPFILGIPFVSFTFRTEGSPRSWQQPPPGPPAMGAASPGFGPWDAHR